jgi:hypothetical protein
VPTGSDEQLRTPDKALINGFRITLSEHANVAAGAFTVVGQNGTYTNATVTTSAQGDYRSVDWIANGGLQWVQAGTPPVTRLGDALEITINAAAITKSVGTQLDGEFQTNPTSVNSSGTSILPTGNAVAGGSTVSFRVIILPGDFNRDNMVDLTDKGILQTNFGRTNATYAEGDATGDGAVDLNDFSVMKANFGLDWRTWPRP